MNALVEQDPKWEFKKKNHSKRLLSESLKPNFMLKCKMYTRGARLIKKTLAMFRFRPKKRKGNMIAFVVFFLYCHSIYCRSKVIAISVFIFYFHGNMCKFFTSCVDIRKVKICHKQLFRFEQKKMD